MSLDPCSFVLTDENLFRHIIEFLPPEHAPTGVCKLWESIMYVAGMSGRAKLQRSIGSLFLPNDAYAVLYNLMNSIGSRGSLKEAISSNRKWRETIEMQIYLTGLSDSRSKEADAVRRKLSSLVLPHICVGRILRIGCMVRYRNPEWEEAVERVNDLCHGHVIVTLLEEEELKAFKRDRKVIKRWIKNEKFDGFVCSAMLIRRIVRIMGASLNKSGFFPRVITHAKDLSSLVEKFIRSPFFIGGRRLGISHDSPRKRVGTLHLPIGHVELTRVQLIHNITALLRALAASIEKSHMETSEHSPTPPNPTLRISRMVVKSSMGKPHCVIVGK